MADVKCGLRYCDATVADYHLIVDDIQCPCMNCFGTKCDTCDILKKSAELKLDMQRQMCSKCLFYNGR